MKKSVIVYGLGKEYEEQKYFIENSFHIIGYSDKKEYAIEKYVEPEQIAVLEYDFVYVTSLRYYEEIEEELENIYSIDKGKIISKDDVLGKFQNYMIREKWIADKLRQIPEGKIILDAGAGQMRYAKYCTHLKYIAQDFGEYNSNTSANKGIDKNIESWDKWDTSKLNIVCDIINMPLEDDSIDVILCSEVFEHLKNPILAVKEFSRILKKGGELILTAPFCCLTHMAPYFYYNGFSEYWYREHLKDSGFEIEEMTPYGNFFQYLGQELFRVNDMAEKYCHETLKKDEIKTIIEAIKILSHLSEKDTKSDETLCFGYRICARLIK